MDDPPVLSGRSVTLRPGAATEVAALQAVLSEPSVVRWWGEPPSAEETAGKLLPGSYAILLVIEVAGEVAGGIEYNEEEEPQYRHAGIDIFVAARWQSQGVGAEAVGLLARYLIDVRGHHRITIDPAAENSRAIAAYAKLGFRPVGVMRRYQRLRDGRWVDALLMDLLADELVR